MFIICVKSVVTNIIAYYGINWNNKILVYNLVLFFNLNLQWSKPFSYCLTINASVHLFLSVQDVLALPNIPGPILKILQTHVHSVTICSEGNL